LVDFRTRRFNVNAAHLSSTSTASGRLQIGTLHVELDKAT
jgi:hypothetical protein